MRAAVERHVLEEVREALLIVGFVERARLDRQPQRHALRRTRFWRMKYLRPFGSVPVRTAASNGTAS